MPSVVIHDVCRDVGLFVGYTPQVQCVVKTAYTCWLFFCHLKFRFGHSNANFVAINASLPEPPPKKKTHIGKIVWAVLAGFALQSLICSKRVRLQNNPDRLS